MTNYGLENIKLTLENLIVCKNSGISKVEICGNS